MSDASEKALVCAPQWGGHNHLFQGLSQTSLTEGTPTLYNEKIEHYSQQQSVWASVV